VPCSGCSPTGIGRLGSDQHFHRLVDRKARGFRLSRHCMSKRQYVHDEPSAPRQPLPPSQQDRGVGRAGQPGTERHGVGRSPKKWGPHALPKRRHLVRQQTHGTATAQRFDQLLDTRQRGGCGVQPRALPGTGHHFTQPGLARGAKQHRHALARDGAVSGCVGAGRDLKTPHVRGQKQNALPSRQRGVNVLTAHHANRYGLAQPQTRQLSHHFPCLRDSGQRVTAGHPSQSCVSEHMPSVGGGHCKHHPPHDSASCMQRPQRPVTEKTKQMCHGQKRSKNATKQLRVELIYTVFVVELLNNLRDDATLTG
jgi:hypothetical protein